MGLYLTDEEIDTHATTQTTAASEDTARQSVADYILYGADEPDWDALEAAHSEETVDDWYQAYLIDLDLGNVAPDVDVAARKAALSGKTKATRVRERTDRRNPKKE